ncbi:Toxin of toxin-antitoxin (TA) system [uncultured spirochete]|jgi:Txe/YoeB family toxin of toxin-antitoxin system|uniref:Putative mRNA interferase YoeB n=1 Tax=uncultured spirochete TaxID=156406 RepID=A0A3P3XS26_9SPIR|nr:Toxin of toxin-antitoxin (TA) system [uncultured spirochete]
MWEVVYTKQADKDSKKIAACGLKERVQNLIEILKEDPFKNPPSYKKLLGDFNGAYSRRINIQHRLVYQVFEKEHIVRVLRMWTHYE